MVVGGAPAGHQYFRIASRPPTGALPCAGSNTASSVNVLITPSASPASHDVLYFSMTFRIEVRSCSVSADLPWSACASPAGDKARSPIPTTHHTARSTDATDSLIGTSTQKPELEAGDDSPPCC